MRSKCRIIVIIQSQVLLLVRGTLGQLSNSLIFITAAYIRIVIFITILPPVTSRSSTSAVATTSTSTTVAAATTVISLASTAMILLLFTAFGLFNDLLFG